MPLVGWSERSVIPTCLYRHLATEVLTKPSNTAEFNDSGVESSLIRRYAAVYSLGGTTTQVIIDYVSSCFDGCVDDDRQINQPFIASLATATAQ